MESTKITLTDKTSAALGFLQANEGQYFGSDIAEATGLNAKGISGVMNSLVKKGLVDKADAEREVLVVGKDGAEKATVKTLKVYFLTEAGRDFVIGA